MDRFDKIQEKMIFKATIVQKDNVSNFLANSSKSLLNKQKIPNVIHISKTYDTFSWNISESLHKKFQSTNIDSKLLSEFVLILLSIDEISGYIVGDVEFYLKPNFYSHSELIKMLTPINLEFSAYELIGDIIHLNLSDQQLEYKQTIADIIHFKTQKTVINKIGKIEDTFRFYHCEVLAGSNNLTTIHKENDVKLFLDLGRVYWCSRLQNERIRLLKMIKPGQIVCDPFCGVGPHVIPAIKKGANALCNDLNPAAIECLQKSLELNKIECDCLENMDAGDFLTKYKDFKVDHFIFNLPEHSLKYIKYTTAFKGIFYLHVFFFCKSEEIVSEFVKEMTGYKVKNEWIREVRKVSPSKSVYKIEIKNDTFFKFQMEQ